MPRSKRTRPFRLPLLSKRKRSVSITVFPSRVPTACMSMPDKKQKPAGSFIYRKCGDVYGSLHHMHSNQHKFGDITVLTETSRFKCSSAMLASSSPVLAAMIFGHMADPSTSLDQLPENRTLHLRHLPQSKQYSSESFELVLQFIHGLRVELDVATAANLCVIADYLGIVSMHDACLEYLMCFSTPEAQAVVEQFQTSEKRKIHKCYEGGLTRRHNDVYDSLGYMYSNQLEFGDIGISVDMSGQETMMPFRCSSAMLASASPWLAKMIVADMDDKQRILQLRDLPVPIRHLHESIEFLLKFIHGLSIKLESIETAVRLHALADYLEVLCLCDACSQYLTDALCVHNVCGILTHMYDVNSALLKERCLYLRCLHMLTLEFARVVDSDPEFTSLDPETLLETIKREKLGCSSEASLWNALLKWWDGSVKEKNPWLLKMATKVRWKFVSDEQGKCILSDARLLALPEVKRCVQEFLRSKASYLSPSRSEATLVAYSPQPFWSPYFGDQAMFAINTISGLVVGRSRGADVQIGQDCQPPYISGEHFKVYFDVDYNENPPIVRAKLHDSSMNGTYVNGTLIGKGNTCTLQHKDQIEIVLGNDEEFDDENEFEPFPYFVYYEPSVVYV